MTVRHAPRATEPAPAAPSRRVAPCTGAAVLLCIGVALGGCWPSASPTSSSSKPQAEAGDALVATVDGVEIRQSDLKLAEEDFGSTMPPMTADAKREQLIKFITDVILIARAGEGKFGQGVEFQRRLAFNRHKLLMEMHLRAEAKTAVTDAALRQVYDEAIKQNSAEQEVHARHILVPTEDEAKAILADVKKGGDFAEIAKAKSKDSGSGAQGGDLGYFTKDQMVPEFAEVAFQLEKGQVSAPVKSQFGWHIIKVEDKRTKPIPEFDKVKDQLEQYAVRRSQAALIAKLRESAKIERMDANKPLIVPIAPGKK